jgi:hypothetical protein
MIEVLEVLNFCITFGHTEEHKSASFCITFGHTEEQRQRQHA